MIHFFISFILSLLLAIVAYLKKATTKSALFLSFIFSFIITYCGGISSYLILLIVFLGSIIKNILFKKVPDNITKKEGAKDIFQILANVLLGTIFTILYKITNNSIYFIIYASTMAESLSDTLASDIGVHSKKEPLNILTFKKSIPGLSGNISLLGLVASFLGSFLIGFIFYLFKFNLIGFIIIIITGFLGSIFDSLLGATIQVKYKCSCCGNITEKTIHCQNKTNYYKGITFINNDTVNFLSNVFSVITSLLLIKILVI